MKNAVTAVVERAEPLTPGCATEPYETAWAHEARWFVHLLDLPAGATLRFQAETSPEGLTWCAHEAAPVTMSAPGLATVPLANVGPWQRLSFDIDGADAVRAIVYLTLKG